MSLFAAVSLQAQDEQWKTGTNALGGNGAPAAEKPYAVIVARNIFGLVPIPPPDPNADKPPADPPPKITPTGIMTLFGRLQALFRVANKPKPGQPAKEDAHVLGEGEMVEDIEVVKIDQANRSITFNNHGTVQELPLVAAKDTGPAPGMVSRGTGGGIPSPRLGGTGAAPMTPADRAALFKSRREGTVPSFGQPAGSTAGSGNTGVALGGGNFGGNFGGQTEQSMRANANESVTPEQQVMLMEAQRMQFLQQKSPMANLLPPTPLTQQNVQENDQGQVMLPP